MARLAELFEHGAADEAGGAGYQDTHLVYASGVRNLTRRSLRGGVILARRRLPPLPRVLY